MKFNYKIFIFSAVVLISMLLSTPSFFQTEIGKKITLGLDLQGGLHLLLGIKTNKVIESKIKDLAMYTKNYCDNNDILTKSFSIKSKRFEVTILDNDDLQKMKNYFLLNKNLIVINNKNSFKVSLNPLYEKKIIKQSLSQAIETIRNRLDQFGLSEPLVAQQGKDKILVELAGIKTQKEEQRARELISKSATLNLMAIDEAHQSKISTITNKKAKEYGDIIINDSKNPNIKYLVNEMPIINGKMLTDAHVAFNKSNKPVIAFTLNSVGAKIFANFTEKNIGKRLAIVLDNKVASAPKINERIGGGSGQISGDYTISSAKDLAIALRSGSLSAPVYVLEKRSVGPSLGADSIKSSLIALSSGFLLVFIFMLVYYRIAGVIADIALISNIFIIIAIMSLFGATLTLPGMAGIVLTVGMAVDANVIINERIRELLRLGKPINKAIENGYSNAMSAIMDANITTLIASIVLYVYGTGAIKGFAITMSIGIFASMFTAIYGTHSIYLLLSPTIKKTKNFKLWFGIKGK